MPPRITKTGQQLRRTFVKQWREKKGLSLDKAVARLSELVNGISKSSLSRIENGKQPYTQHILEAMSDVYQIDVPSLIMRDPSRDDAPWSIEESLPPVQREAIEKIAEGVKQLINTKGTGTDG